MLIVAVIGLAVALALWQFQTLATTQNDLLRKSVPILVRAQVIERAIHDIFITLGNLETIPSSADLSGIEKDVSTQIRRAHRSVESLSWAREHHAQTSLLRDHLQEMEEGIQRDLLITRGLFETEDKIEALRQRLMQQRNEIRILVEQLAFVAARDMQSSVAEMLSRGARSGDDISHRLTEETDRLSLVSQIALELETVANVVGQLGKAVPLEQLNDTHDFLAFRMRGAMKLMVRLPDAPERAELAVKVAEFRETTLGPEGVLHQFETYVDLSHELALEYASTRILVREMTAATEQLSSAAYESLSNAGQITQLTTQRLILILALAALSVSIIVMLAILFIVERQINHRIALLTNAVLRIAAGETDHEIHVGGDDELGRMAMTLDIFKRNARELLRSNAELEKFAYAAAHDLRSPLQAIHDLTTWTIEDEENHLSADSSENLKLLQARISRLSALLADLLQYARVGADSAEPEPVVLDDLIKETLAMVDPAGTFTIVHDGPDEAFETFVIPLQKVFLNLMSNTLKHHQSGEGTIRVASQLQGDRLVIEYSDDGPGIPVEFHEKVFDLFQTLKSRDETEGSGLGLAITQKLIEHLDGTIRIRPNSDVQSGALFEFDFPVFPAADLAQAA